MSNTIAVIVAVAAFLHIVGLAVGIVYAVFRERIPVLLPVGVLVVSAIACGVSPSPLRAVPVLSWTALLLLRLRVATLDRAS